MNLNLDNKVIIVSGGSKGIGGGITLALSKEKAIPIIIGRNKKSINSIMKVIKDLKLKADYAFAELTDSKECEKAIDFIYKKYGQIDGLVNNAGINDGIGLKNGTSKQFIDSINKNVTHYFQMAKLALPGLKKSKGSIVNIGSKVSYTGQGGTSGYAAACGARNALTREWAVELINEEIRVNEVIVAECYTPLYEKWIKTFKNPKEKINEISQKIPLGKRMTTVEEISNMVIFLLSNKSSHTTGQIIFVDGGYSHLDRTINS